MPDDPDMPLDNPDQPDAEEDETVVPAGALNTTSDYAAFYAGAYSEPRP